MQISQNQSMNVTGGGLVSEVDRQLPPARYRFRSPTDHKPRERILNEFRFRTAETSGTIRLLDNCVETVARRNLTRWSYQIPLADLDPHPTRIWTTSASFWWSLLIGSLGVLASIYEFLGIEERHLPLWVLPIMLLGASGLLWYAYSIRREEWVVFSAGADSCVRFPRNGPDSDAFSEFTGILIDRINTAHRGELPRPPEPAVGPDLNGESSPPAR